VTKEEVAKLLALASTIDKRKVDIPTVNGWFEVIGHLPYEASVSAMWAHFRNSTDYLLPAHITKAQKSNGPHVMSIEEMRAKRKELNG
jgi:hypothetical protein